MSRPQYHAKRTRKFQVGKAQIRMPESTFLGLGAVRDEHCYSNNSDLVVYVLNQGLIVLGKLPGLASDMASNGQKLPG